MFSFTSWSLDIGAVGRTLLVIAVVAVLKLNNMLGHRNLSGHLSGLCEAEVILLLACGVNTFFCCRDT